MPRSDFFPVQEVIHSLETKCMIGKQSVFFHNMILQCQLKPKEVTIISWIEGQLLSLLGERENYLELGNNSPSLRPTDRFEDEMSQFCRFAHLH